MATQWLLNGGILTTYKSWDDPPSASYKWGYTLQPLQPLEMAENKGLGGGFKDFLFSPLFGEDSHFD